MGSIDGGLMSAAQYNKISNKIEVNRIPIPSVKDNEILIKTRCATLCHSDLMLFWDHTSEKPATDTVTIGHENTGYVVELGKNVKGFKKGDRVGCLGCSYACYECEGCQIHNLFCEKGTQRLHGFQCDGHFAEYSVADYRNAMVLPDGMDMVSSAPLFCAGVTAFHVIQGCQLKEGQWIAVVGCGGLGHLAVQYAKALGFKVIGVDVSNSQLEAARELGAEFVVNTLEDSKWESRIKEITAGGCHAACVFSASNVAYENAPRMLRINGLLMIAGIPTKPLSVPPIDVLLGKYRIAGRSSGVPKNMPAAIHFSQRHNIQPKVTTFNRIEDIHRLVELMKSGKASGRFGIVLE